MWIFLISLSTYLIYTYFKYIKTIHIMGKNKYNVKNNYKNYLLTPDIFAIIPIILILNTNVRIANITIIIFYMILCLYEIKTYKNYKINKKNKTNAIVLLIIFLIILLTILLKYDNYYIFFDYLILILFAYLSYFIMYLINSLVKYATKLIKQIKK